MTHANDSSERRGATMTSNEQLPAEKSARRFVVTKNDSVGYWVREDDGSSYWPNRGLFLFKWSAIRRAKKLMAKQVRFVNNVEEVVWERSDG